MGEGGAWQNVEALARVREDVYFCLRLRYAVVSASAPTLSRARARKMSAFVYLFALRPRMDGGLNLNISQHPGRLVLAASLARTHGDGRI